MTALHRGLIVALRAVLALLIAGAVLLAAGMVLAPATDHRLVVIRSGSMEPAMPVGSLLVVASVDPREVRPGDVVTVAIDSGSLLTHRVLRVTSLDGYPAVELHGDANAVADVDVVSLDRLVGRVALVAPIAGFAAWWLANPAGLAAFVALIGLIAVVIRALGRRSWRPRRRHRRIWKALRRGPLGAQAAVVERGLWLGLDRPVLALALALVLAAGGGATLVSGAFFTASAGVGGNTFTTGMWAPSDYRSVSSGPWGAAATWERYNGIAWVVATRPPSSTDGVVTVSAGHSVNVTADVVVDQVVVTSGGQLTIAGGVVVRVEDGPGTDVDLPGTLDAAGTLTVQSGAVVAIGGGGLLRNSGLVDGSGTLAVNSGTIQASGGARTIALPMTLSGDLTVPGDHDLTCSGVITGSGSLVKTGSGTLVLARANTYTGATTVSGGTLALGIANAIGSASAVTVAGGATLDLAGYAETMGSLAGAGTVTSSVTGAVTLTVGNTTGTTFSGVLADGAGTLALTKAGTGTLVLAGANTYTGATTVSGGIVRVQAATALGTTATGTTVASGAAIEIDGAGLVIAEPVTSLIGTGVGGSGALRNLAGANTWSGAITLGTGGATVASDAGTLTTGAVGGATRTLTVTGAGNTTIGGVIATTSGTLVKTGTGTLTLARANTYTGATTVSGGIVRVQAATALGTTATGTTVASGAAIEIDGAGLVITEPVTSLIGTGVGGTRRPAQPRGRQHLVGCHHDRRGRRHGRLRRRHPDHGCGRWGDPDPHRHRAGNTTSAV